jgi:TIR domain
MSRIFLSHSSKDDFPAVAVRDWLSENGWDDVFLDLDPAQGIHPGERWERALHEQASHCEAVLFLVSASWLSSDWCRREHELAHRLNKRIFVVLIEDIAIKELPPFLTEAHQAVSLASGEDHQLRRVTLPITHEERHVSFSTEGLARLRAGLTQAGLDPRFFAWPPENEPNRAPYRGLEPLEIIDAGIFFGRDAPVIEALDALRGLRETACPRLFVILGASGAGKSSFLRAGLLPRLSRDDRAFLPLAAIRPGRAAITGADGLVAALATACAEKGLSTTRAELREAAAKGDTALRPYLKELVSRGTALGVCAKPLTLVFVIDQAEELFRAEGASEGEALLALVRDLVSVDDPAIIALFAIRSDGYDALEHAKAFEGLSQKAFPLLPMPRGAYQTVIEGPAQRLAQAGRKFEIDPSLTEALLTDLEAGGGSDALPLLAFTLEQLYLDHRAAGRLTYADYKHFGGLKGAIEGATARVFAEADKDPRIPRDRDARLALLRRGLIPWLAGIDPETRAPRRRRASATQIPQEARPLIDLLVEQRLLTRAVDPVTHESTLEPAHEALLRQWGSLKGWLEEDFARLVTLEGVKRATRDWDANARDMAWAAHNGARLEEATRLDTRPDLAALLDPTDRTYLAACREKQSEEQAKERALIAAEQRAARRTRIGLVASSMLAALAIAAAAFGFWQAGVAREQKANAEQQALNADQSKKDAEQQTLKAEQRSALLAASVSQSFTDEGSLDQALLLMLDAAHVFDDGSVPDEIRIAFTKALLKRERIETKTLFPNMRVFETDNALLLFDPAARDIWKVTDSIEPQRLLAGTPNDGGIVELRQSADKNTYIVLRDDLQVERIDATSGVRHRVGSFVAPKPRPGETYNLYEPETKITDDGLVVRWLGIERDQDPHTPGETDSYVQAMDAQTGAVLQGELSGIDAVTRKSPGGGVYGVSSGDKGTRVYQITAAKDGLLVKPAKLSEADTIKVRFGACVAGMPIPLRASVVKGLNDSLQPGGRLDCKKIGSGYLMVETNPSSAGEISSETLYTLNDHKITVRDTLAEAVSGDLSNNNFAWVGEFPATVALAAKLKKDWLGVLLNRNAYVLVHDPAIDKVDGSENWTLALNYRHPGFVTSARFAGNDKLIVVDTEARRLYSHDYGNDPSEKLLVSPLQSIVHTDTPINTLHHGTCVGYSIPRPKSVRMADGRDIIYETSSATESSDKHQLEVSGTTNTVVALGDDANCVQFSADWKRLLVVRDKAVVLYDWQRVLAKGTLDGNALGTLKTPGVYSALFVGADGSRIMTTDGTNRVLLWTHDANKDAWQSAEMYRGDNPIIYAEPDATGDRIILIENLGEGDVHGLLYSVGAREIWFDLGTDYKLLGAAFADNANIIVSEHESWKRTFLLLSLSALATLGDKELSPECRPPSPGDYRKSSCWPTSYK